jgi:hypothetical protein
MRNRQILYDFQNCRYHSGSGSIEAPLLLRPVDGTAADEAGRTERRVKPLKTKDSTKCPDFAPQ